MNFFQHLALLVDWAYLCCIICILLRLVMNYIRQLYIRTRCRYKGAKIKSGRACVICDQQDKCDRAMESEEYRRYLHAHFFNPDQAKKMYDEIWAEEQANE